MRALLAALPLLAGLAAGGAIAAEPDCIATTPMQRRLEYRSVAIQADRRVLFRFCAPGAKRVKLTSTEIDGVPTGFSGGEPGLSMRRDVQGYWTATTPGPLAPGTYRFAFNIDGVDMADPQGTRFAEDFRGVRSVFEVPGPAVAFAAYDAGVPHGLVSVIDYPSTTQGAVRRAHVYTPPGYEGADGRRYPTLYLVHGAGDSDDSWTAIGHANLILDNLIAAGNAVPMILVMPFGHTPPRPGVERMVNTDFAADLLTDLVPYVDAHFRTRPAAVARGMAGLSMGGAHTLNFGLTHPELFGPIGVFSIGIAGGDPVAAYRARNDAALRRRAAAATPTFYAFGRDDFLYARMMAPTRRIMDDYGIRYTYHESAGGHSWANWRAYLALYLPTLFH